MSSYQSAAPPANGGLNLLSCDTFAGAGAPVAGISGGAPPPPPPDPEDPQFSTMTLGMTLSQSTLVSSGPILTASSVSCAFSLTPLQGGPVLNIPSCNTLQVSSLNDLPVVSPSTFSTMTAGQLASSPQMFVSSIGGVNWTAFVSTVNGLAGGGGGTPPSSAPSVPFTFTVGNTSMVTGFETSTITGSPPPSYSVRYGSTIGSLTASQAAAVSTGTIYSATLNNLYPGVPYYVQSVASNTAGTLSSLTSTITTLGTPTTPSTPVILAGPGASSITLAFDTSNFGVAPVTKTLFVNGVSYPTPTTVSSTYNTYQLSTLTPVTGYSSISLATNAQGSVASAPLFFSTTSGPPPVVDRVSTILAVPFFVYQGGEFVLNTSANVNVGNWNCSSGTIDYPATPPGGITGPEFLSSLQTDGNKIVISLGGATANPAVLSTMFQIGGAGPAGTTALRQSLAYAFFGGSAAENPLNFNNTSWSGFQFDGIDLDIEAATPFGYNMFQLASELKTFKPDILITAAPQTPYIVSSFAVGSGLNANGTFFSYTNMFGSTNLNTEYVGVSTNAIQDSVLGPNAVVDYIFLQCYNNDSFSYPGTANWTKNLAAWGLQSVLAEAKLILAFASQDGAPIFNPTDANFISTLNGSAVAANLLIQGFSSPQVTGGAPPFTTVSTTDWLGGFGFWSAGGSGLSDSMNMLSTVYSNNAFSTIPANVCMTYGNASSGASWNWTAATAPVPNARGYI